MAISDVKAFPERLLSDDSLIVLLRQLRNKPLGWKIAGISFTTGVAHHYISYDVASGGFFENHHNRRKESRLAVRGHNEAALTILSPLGASDNYFGGFDSVSGRGLGKSRDGNPLSVRVAPHYLRGLSQVDALFDEARAHRKPLTGELISHACHVAQRTYDYFVQALPGRIVSCPS